MAKKKKVKITKEQWEILELMELKVHGGYDGSKDIKGIFEGKLIYEVHRGTLDSNFNLTGKNGHQVTIYDEDLYSQMCKELNKLLEGVV